MMEPFETIDIQELPLSVPRYMGQVMDFLIRNDLRYEEVDLYLAALDPDGRIIAGAGLYRDVIKLVAVSSSARSSGLVAPLVSRLVATAAERGYTNLKVFTKPENRAIFESLGFHVLAESPKTVLMENGRGLEEYCRYLRQHRASGVIVMNANPFTLGHRYLVEQAFEESKSLVVIPVMENVSQFPYEERLEMIRRGCGDLADVVEGSSYQISAATFPTYFLKDLTDASDMQMRLDIDLFARFIAPALGATIRFVGSEPLDELTAAYNVMLKELLPQYGIRVVEVPRLRDEEDPVSASRVRGALDAGVLPLALTPASTWPYLLADLAQRALRIELNMPLKPGLVCSESSGAHADMDYALMRRGIDAIRPFFPRMTMAASAEELRQLGIDAEAAMLAATGGVNTHRGAIFALGLALNVFGRRMEGFENERIMRDAFARLAESIYDNSLKDSEMHFTASSHGARSVEAYGSKGAMQMALDGYKELFDSWLPYFRTVKANAYALQKLLLKIMSELDDTCIIHRVGFERAQAVKAEAKALLGEIAGQAGNDGRSQAGNDGTVMPEPIGHLKELCARYAAEGISPGGAADMLALTVFMDSISQLH